MGILKLDKGFSSHTKQKNQAKVQKLITTSVGRRKASGANSIHNYGGPNNDKTSTTVPLDWKEVCYTNQLPSRIRSISTASATLSPSAVCSRPSARPGS